MWELQIISEARSRLQEGRFKRFQKAKAFSAADG